MAVLTVVAALVAALVRSPEGVLPVTYGLLALGCAAFVLCRRPIRAAKTSEGWFREVPVRLTAPLGDVPRPPVAVHWYVLAAALVLATAAFGWTRYDTLPDPFPTHWDGDGRPDAFAARSVWSAFGPLLVAVGLTVLLAALASLVRRTPLRPRAGDADPLARPLATERAAQSLLGVVALLGAGLVCAVSSTGGCTPSACAGRGSRSSSSGPRSRSPSLVTAVRSRARARRRKPVRRRPPTTTACGAAACSTSTGGPRPARPQARRGRLDAQRRAPVGRALAIGLLVLVGAGLALAVAGTTLGS